ncbi:MAG TPA: hypothetical protein VEK57_21980 [Thermoanaerobaculia bacterium]|nr:hypothetical protein [Thermoanaerobaculia bacterium]
MRSAALLLILLSLASCHAGPPQLVEPSPVPAVTPSGRGSRPAGNVPPRAATPCREVSRMRCALEECGASSDSVTLRCPDGKDVHRCVANAGCPAR